MRAHIHEPLLIRISVLMFDIHVSVKHVCLSEPNCRCLSVFRAAVSRSASDGEVHSVDGSLHCEERRRSAAQQHRHHAHPALQQLPRPHQQPCCWSVHFHFISVSYIMFIRLVS